MCMCTYLIARKKFINLPKTIDKFHNSPLKIPLYSSNATLSDWAFEKIHI